MIHLRIAPAARRMAPACASNADIPVLIRKAWIGSVSVESPELPPFTDSNLPGLPAPSQEEGHGRDQSERVGDGVVR